MVFRGNGITQEQRGDSTEVYWHQTYSDMCLPINEERIVEHIVGRVAKNDIDTVIGEGYKENTIIWGEINHGITEKRDSFFDRYAPARTMALCEEKELNFRCDSALASIPYFTTIKEMTIYRGKE